MIAQWAQGSTRVEFLLVFLGSGIGGMLRHGVGRTALALFGPSFPYGTMAINIVGSFAMGIVAGWFTARGGADQSLRLFLTTGVIGGFTTYSTFSLDYAFLWEGGHALSAILYVSGSLVIGIGALFVGLALSRFL
ncbi:hypothetical protein ASE72_00240 [Sphingomonas sp. Leaf20]|nr:hypothetical protein ASE72_00240 [Sphingomonas sp. Leaf20]